MKTYLKTFPKMFKRHLTRLVSVFLMVLVSVGFTAGIGMSTDKMAYSLDDYYRDANISDLILKSTRDTGFTEDEIALAEERYGKENVQKGFSLEIKGGELDFGGMKITVGGVGEGITRIYCFPNSNIYALTQNKPKVVTDNKVYPSDLKNGEYLAWAERETAQMKGFEDGAVTMQVPLGGFTISHTYRLGGTVQSPLHFATRDDASMQYEGEELENVLYIFDCPPITGNLVNDLYITLPDRAATLFSGAYEDKVKTEQEEAGELFADCAPLTLYENFSFASFDAYEGKIEGIGYVLMAVFLCVTLLVVLSTMTRLLEEERGQIACLQTLGYSPLMILSKYLLFAVVGTAIGAVGAWFAGEALSYIIYINFDWNYALPPYSLRPAAINFIIAATVILASTLIATFAAGMHKTRETPAVLLRPRTPKAGRKVILERIPILWNRLSFKYKSTMRNVLRFRMRFAMTVVAVMASTALVVAGLAVLDCCLFQDIGTAAMIGVAIIVLVFAALLNAVVIYTLTNINISERNRELATLMVLGYQDNEVALYVYREIYITSAIGIALGLPFGCLLCLFVFSVLDFGSLGGISWFVWIIAAVLSLIFTFAVTLMLRPKIVKIDMNESLKAIE